MGRVFGREVTRGEFAERLHRLRLQLGRSADAETLWARLAFLGEAERLGLELNPAALAAREAELVREWWVEAEMRRRFPTGALPHQREAREAARAELHAAFRASPELTAAYAESREMSREALATFLSEQLIIQGLLAEAARGWPIEARAFERWRERRGSARIQVLTLSPALLSADAPAPDELALRGFYEREPWRFRLKRQLRLRLLARPDDGDLRPLAEARAAWQAAGAPPAGEALRELGLAPVDELAAGAEDPLGAPAVIDILNRAAVGELVGPLRARRTQLLIEVLEARPARALSFEEAVAEGRLAREWREASRMGALLERGHALLRELQRDGWRRPPSGPGLRLSPVVEVSDAMVPVGDLPLALIPRVLERDAGEGAVVPELAERRVHLLRILDRARPAEPPASWPEGLLGELREELARGWRVDVRLRARGVSEAARAAARGLLAPQRQLVLRALVAEEASAASLASFDAGESLELVAARLGREAELAPRVSASASPLVAAALRLEPGQVEGPLRVGDEMLLLMVEDVTRVHQGPEGPRPERLRDLYVWSRRIGEDLPKAAAALAGEREALERTSAPSRLKAFRRGAAASSESATAELGGLCGRIRLPEDELGFAITAQLSLLRAGQRRRFQVGETLVMLTVLDERPLPEAERLRLDEGLDAALGWSASWR